MFRTLRSIASLLGGVAFLLMGTGLLTTLIPLRGGQMGFSITLLGCLTSTYYAGFLVGTYAAPPLIRRIGHIRAFAFCAACCACAVLLHALSSNPWLWLALRLLTGTALVGLYTVIESWLNAQAEPSQRGSVFATYMVVNLGSLALAQQLLHIRTGQNFVLFVLAALLVCMATMPVLLTRQAQPTLRPAPRLRLKQLFAVAPSAGVGTVLTGLAMGAFWGLAPVYATHLGLSTAAVGTYMSVGILGGAALQWPLGRLSDRHDRRLTLSMICTCACAVAILTPLLQGIAGTPFALVFLYGGMAFAVYPIVVAHLLDHLPPEDVLAASSSVLLLNGIGSAVGPLVAGTLMNVLGAWALFTWFALMHGILAVYAAYRYLSHVRIPTEETNFRPMLRTSPAALEMLPATRQPDGAQESRHS